MKTLLKTVSTLVSIVRLYNTKPVMLPQPEGKSINILGNTPKVKERAIDYSYPTMVTNGFAINLEFCIKVKPTYYVFCDDYYYDPTCYNAAVMIEAMNKKDWDMNILTPNPTKHDFVINKNHRYNKTTIEGFEKFVLWCMKHNLGMPSTANVLIPCLVLAINMGYKEIHLYGFEFDWYKELIFKEKQSSNNFYRETDKIKYQELETVTHSLYQTVFGLSMVKKYAEQNNVKITNHSEFNII
jgi:hypothetical protein